MQLRTLFLLFAALIGTILRAQTNVPFDDAHFTDAAGLDNALSEIRQGDKLFTDGGSHFNQALEHYEKAYAFNPDNAELDLKIGLCHLNGRYHHKCLPFFERTLALDPSTPRIHFLVGYAYQLHAEWDKAIEEYNVHKAAISRVPDPQPLYNTADQRIQECINGKSLQAKPIRGQVTNLGTAINSEVADYGVLITADGENMMFTSRRSNTTGGKINKATNEYFEDIYACQRTATGWTEPKPLPEPVNSNVNDASVGLFNDGRTMIVYRDGKGNGDLFESTRQGDTWSAPVSMGPEVNSKGNETSAWYSFDRKQLYFVSDREGGQGGQDIWMSRWDGIDSTWGEAENLGPNVNTPYDEDGIFVHPDGKTIYFSSKGHDCMGGFDVFVSTRADGDWTKAQNLGWPINSPDDDLFFVLTADGSTGYFSSVRPCGSGEDDLYRVDFAPEAKAEETASANGMGAANAENTNAMNTVLLKGHIMNYSLIEGVEARIDLLDLKDGSLTASFSTDPKTGEYMVVVPSGHDYAMNVHASGYLLHSENISTADGTGTMQRDIDIAMQPLESGHTEVMRNVFFEKDEAVLSPSSLAELGQVLELMRENPKLRLEIGGHTDSDGSDAHNEELSTARAHAVMDHLINNGIPAERLEAKGYAASEPLVPNDSEEHKAQNRRTQVRVL